MLKKFDKARLIRDLSQLSKQKQLAFGLFCCERLLPNYIIFSQENNWGDIIILRESTLKVWSVLSGLKLTKDDIDLVVTRCEEVTPDSDEFDSLYVSFAQDACFSVCCLFDFILNGESGRIAQIAEFATDSLDLYIQEVENLQPNDTELEQKILENPLMQNELSRQAQDISNLEVLSNPIDEESINRLQRHYLNSETSIFDYE